MEQELLNIAVDNLSTTSGIIAEVDLDDLHHDHLREGHIKFFLDSGSFTLPFIIKRKITSAQLPFLKDYTGRNGVIVFESATKSVKDQLRNLGINYLEASGNTYLAHNGIFIFIDTNKKINSDDLESNSAFSKTGLKVIYQLLTNKENIALSYRDIGQLSGVSIDTVSRVYKELVRDKYVVKVTDRKHKIFDYERLFKDWVTLFNKTLRPKLKKRSFRFRDKGQLRDLLNVNINGKIGGELAAEKLSGHLIAEKANIYLAGSFVELALSLHLIPDKDGPITMIEQFWKEKPAHDHSDNLASLPLVYADLLSDPKPRNLETAKTLYQAHVHQYI